ncbi:MAG: hypothetical protein AAF493_29915, partial [Pseudomonadota bacterium]
LPLESFQGPDKGTGVFLLLFGLFFSGIPIVILYTLLTGGEVKSDFGALGTTLFLMGFIGIGVCVALAGLHMLVRRVDVVITSRRVTGRRRGLFGTYSWEDPLDVYRGLLPEKIERRSKNRSYTLYLVTLKHFGVSKRDVELYRSTKGKQHRRITERFATLLQKPVLTDAGDAMVARDVEDLDKSIGELAREGKVAVDFDPHAPMPGSRLERTEVLDGYQFRARTRSWKSAIGISVFAGVGLTLLYFYFFRADVLENGEGQTWVVAAVGAAFALFGLIGLCVNLFGELVVDVTRGGVSARQTGRQRSRIRMHDIEEISQKPSALELIGDDDRVSIWTGCLSDAEVDYLRACITAVAFGEAEETAAMPAPTNDHLDANRGKHRNPRSKKFEPGEFEPIGLGRLDDSPEAQATARRIRGMVRAVTSFVGLGIAVGVVLPWFLTDSNRSPTRQGRTVTAQIPNPVSTAESASHFLAAECVDDANVSGETPNANPEFPIAIAASNMSATVDGDHVQVAIGRLCAGRTNTERELFTKGLYVEVGVSQGSTWHSYGRPSTVSLGDRFEIGRETLRLGPLSAHVPYAADACDQTPCEITVRLTLPLLGNPGSYHPFRYTNLVLDDPNQTMALKPK